MYKPVAFLLLVTVFVGGELKEEDHGLPKGPSNDIYGNLVATLKTTPKDETDSEGELGNDIASVVKKSQAVKDETENGEVKDENGNHVAEPETKGEERNNEDNSVFSTLDIGHLDSKLKTTSSEDVTNADLENNIDSAAQNSQAKVNVENDKQDKAENIKEITAAFIDAEIRQLASKMNSASEASPANEVITLDENAIKNEVSTDNSKEVTLGNAVNPSDEAIIANEVSPSDNNNFGNEVNTLNDASSKPEESSLGEASLGNEVSPSDDEKSIGNEVPSDEKSIENEVSTFGEKNIGNEESSFGEKSIVNNEVSTLSDVGSGNNESPSKEANIGSEANLPSKTSLENEENPSSDVTPAIASPEIKPNTETLSEDTPTGSNENMPPPVGTDGDETQKANEDDCGCNSNAEANNTEKTEIEDNDKSKDEEEVENIVESSEESKSLKTKISTNDDTGLIKGRWHLSPRCLDCLCYMTSNCDLTTLQKGCRGGSCGPFGISYVFWEDATDNKLPDGPSFEGDAEMENEWRTCSLDLKCATAVIKKYFQKYPHDCNGDGKVDCLDYAAIHTLGPFGCLDKSNLQWWNGSRRKQLLRCMVTEEEGRYSEEMRKLEMQDLASNKEEELEQNERSRVEDEATQAEEKSSSDAEKTNENTEEKTVAEIVVDVDVDVIQL